MNGLDVLLLFLMLFAATGGAQAGFLRRTGSWGGGFIGILLAASLMPSILRAVAAGSTTMRLLLGLFVVFVGVSVGSGIGEALGRRLRTEIRGPQARWVDHAAGAAAGVVGILVLLWILLPALSQIPGTVASQTRNSAIAGFVSRVSPDQPQALRALGGLVPDAPLTEVFRGLRPAPDVGPPPGQVPVPQDVLANVYASTSNVEAVGCGRQSEGSGWTVGPNQVLTNAHVVAGADRVRVRRPDGAVLDAQVRKFDPERDIALLVVSGLGQSALSLENLPAGTQGAAVGYPQGQNRPRPAPATITREMTAVGSDIYRESQVRRRILVLSARIEQGDSGGPLVDASGTVGGIIFAAAPDRPSTGYALDDTEVAAFLGQPDNPGSGRCIR